MHWLFLILASVCEICWFYCIGYLNHYEWKEIYRFEFLHKPDAWLMIVALTGYVIFGVVNAILFTKAIKKISPAIGFSVWTGLALAGTALVDALFLHIDLSFVQILSILLILAGVFGIKYFGNT